MAKRGRPPKQPKPCLICGSTDGTQLYTIDALKTVAVTHLCTEHAAPLWEIINATGGVAPKYQVPIPHRREEVKVMKAPPRGKRGEMKLVPLEGWEPPPEPVAVLPPDKTPDAELVKNARLTGSTWAEIGIMLGVTEQEARDQYEEIARPRPLFWAPPS